MKSEIEKVLESNLNTKLREQMIEYKFLSDMILCSASNGKRIEVARSDHDSFGYDVILKVDDKIRYVQLKSRIKSGTRKQFDIHKSLIKNAGGTVVVILIDYKNNDISPEYFLLNDKKKNEILQKEAKNKKENQCLTRMLDKGSDYIKCEDIEDLYKYMFLAE